MEKLSFEEFKSKHFSLVIDPERIAEFEKTHSLDLNQELDVAAKKEYEIYLAGETNIEQVSCDVPSVLEVLLEHQSRIHHSPNINKLLVAITRHFAQYSVIKDVMQIQPISANPGLINRLVTTRNENNQVVSIAVDQPTVLAVEHDGCIFTTEFLADLVQGLIEPNDITDHLLLKTYKNIENEILNEIIEKATTVEIEDTNKLDVFVNIVREANNIAVRSRRGCGNVAVMSEDTIRMLDKLDPDKKMLSMVDNIGYIAKTIKICIHEGVGDKILLAYNQDMSKHSKVRLGDSGGYFISYKLFNLYDNDNGSKQLISTYSTNFYEPENYYTAIELV